MNARRIKGEDDVRDIGRVNTLAWRVAYDGILPDAVLTRQNPDPADEQVHDRAAALRGDRALVLVADDGRVRGYSHFRWGPETKSFVGESEAGLTAIYVAPDCWGEGVATALLERGLEGLPASIDRVRLEALEGNDIGRRFYEARGFERTGTSEFEIVGEAYPAAVYTLEV